MKETVIEKKLKVDILFNSSQTQFLLSDLKYSSRHEFVEGVLENALSTKCAANIFLTKGLFPRQYEDLLTGNYLLYDVESLDRELYWNSYIFRYYNNVINKFLKYKEEYELFFFNGDYVNAGIILDKIDNEICVSLWSLENRFIIKELSDGLEANKAFLNKINELNCNDGVLFLADIFSFKAEKNLTESQYKNRMNRILTSNVEYLKAFLELKMFGIGNFGISDFYNLLFFESIASLIDRYVVFIKVICFACSNSNMLNILSSVIGRSLNIINKIHDNKIYNLNIYMNPNKMVQTRSEYSTEYNSLCEHYIKGNYDQVILNGRDFINNHPTCFEIYTYYVKSYVYLNMQIEINDPVCLRDIILKDMYNSYNKRFFSYDIYTNILKISRIINSYDFYISYFSFFQSRFLPELNEDLSRLSMFNITFDDPRFCMSYDNSADRLNYIKGLQNVYGELSNSNLYKYYYDFKLDGFCSEIDSDRFNWYKMKRLILNEQYDEAIIILEHNCNTCKDNYYIFERSIYYLFKCYLKKGLLLSCIKLYVDSFLSEKVLTIKLDLKSLYNILDVDSDDNLKRNIEYPILTYFYNNDDITEIYSSYANFLDLNNMQKPTDIIKYKDIFDEKKIIYFLRYVCICDVLDSAYYAFITDEEVKEERIKICQYLLNIDPVNEKTYQEEISRITQNLTLAKNIIAIDESRIDFDVKRIREQKCEVLSENYRRYKEIESFDLSYKILDVNSSKIVTYSLYNELDSKVVVEKKNQKYVIFKDMFFDYRDEFAFGQCGLDSSLSTRIRHGRLQNQLRNIFEMFNLVCLRLNSNSNEYILSDYIEKQISNFATEQGLHDSMLEIFSNFSLQIDNIIETLNNKWIRIRTENSNKDGLFDYTFSEEYILLIFSQLSNIETEVALISFFESVLILRLENVLKYIREFINTTLKENIIFIINDLQSSIDKIFEDYHNPLYLDVCSNIIHCRTKMQNEINIISEWFRMPMKQEYPDFSFRQLLDTSTEINRKLYSFYNDVNLVVNDTTQSIISGKTFTYFIDIIQILFNNAINHSGFSKDYTKLEVIFNILEDDYYVSIEMINNLSPEINKDKLVNRIKEVQRIVQEGSQKNKYDNYEGGSGYLKITKLLNYYISVDWYLLFGTTDEDGTAYSVLLKVNKAEILGGDKSEDTCN